MKHLLLLFVLISQLSLGQNLISNPGFEEGLPENKVIKKRNLEGPAGRPFLPGWTVPTLSSPDYFNSSVSKANGVSVPIAHSGKGLAGFVLSESKNLARIYNGSFKEYVQNELKQPLVAGVTYHLSFYLAIDRTTAFYARNIGAYFSKTKLVEDTKVGLHVQPQIRLEKDSLMTSDYGWVKVEGDYLASGGEQFLTIGSFGNDFMQSFRLIGISPKKERGHVFRNAYYYLDDVELVKANEFQQKEIETKNWFIYIDDWESYFIGKNRQYLVDEIEKMLIDLPSEVQVQFALKAVEDSLAVFVPVDKLRNNVFSYLNNLTANNFGATTSSTLSFYYSNFENNKPKNLEVLVISPGKINFKKQLTKQIQSAYLSQNVHFNVLQVEGKNYNAIAALTQSTQGEYWICQPQELSNQLHLTSRYLLNSKDKLMYNDQGSKKMLFILAGTAVLAFLLTRII